MKSRLVYILMLVLAVSCAEKRNRGTDAGLREDASSVARTAAAELSLDPTQEHLLENAICDLFNSLEKRPDDRLDDTDRSLKASEAHKSFQKKVRASFPTDKSAEILAWYYNYSNTNSMQ